MQFSRLAKVTALSVTPFALVAGGFQATAVASGSTVSSDRTAPAFAVSQLSAKSYGGLKDVTGFGAGGAQGKAREAQGLGVVRAVSGETAVVDTSSAGEGITAAAGQGFVELSWKVSRRWTPRRPAATTPRATSTAATAAPSSTGSRTSTARPCTPR